MTTEELYVEPVVSLPLIDRESSVQEWAQQHPVPIGATAEAEAALEAAESNAESNAVLEGVREEIRELVETSGSLEVTQAVSVAAAYFEDTLGLPPGYVLSAGTTGSEALSGMLREAGFGGQEMRVREMVTAEMLGAGASTATVPRCWMAGVRGALKN
jgi:type IV pilus assembly protein PilM